MILVAKGRSTIPDCHGSGVLIGPADLAGGESLVTRRQGTLWVEPALLQDIPASLVCRGPCLHPEHSLRMEEGWCIVLLGDWFRRASLVAEEFHEMIVHYISEAREQGVHGCVGSDLGGIH